MVNMPNVLGMRLEDALAECRAQGVEPEIVITLHDRATTRLGDVQPTYRPGVVPADLRACLPDFIIEDLKFGIRRMDGQLHGFAHPDALLTGVETRSSSPVRLPRNRETLMAERVDELYPAGEGAGFAGGIVSAAVDGIQTAIAALHHHAE